MTGAGRFSVRNGTVFDNKFGKHLASPALIVRRDTGEINGCGNLDELIGPFRNMTSGMRVRDLNDLACETVLVPLGQASLDAYDRAAVLNLAFGEDGAGTASELARTAKHHPDRTADLVREILAKKRR